MTSHIRHLTVATDPDTFAGTSMNHSIPTSSIVIAGLVILFVTLAMAQVVIFDLNKDTRKNLLLHKIIACLGMGAAFYAIFLSRIHFSLLGWAGLAGSVIAIIFVGSLIHKYKPRPYREVIPSSKKKSRRKKELSEKAQKKAKPKEIPSFVFVWTGGFFAFFWGLVLVSPLLWYFFGDDRPYFAVVETYWDSFSHWFTNP